MDDKKDLQRKRVLFVGHVQGVGLRGTLSIRRIGKNLDGWMCNTPNRQVVIAELQGEELLIDAALKKLMGHYNDGSRCRGMRYKIIGELALADRKPGIWEVTWSEVVEMLGADQANRLLDEAMES